MRQDVFVHLLTLLTVAILSSPVLAEEAPKPAGDASAILEPTSPPEYKGPKLKINVAARKLKLYDHSDKLIKTYDVAVGSGRFPTPLGPREMDQIVWNPWWLPPPSDWARNDKPTPPGPRNPLGPVKMRLGSAILIHGTNKPQSVGHAASHGCMRMRSEEAQDIAWYIQTLASSRSDLALKDQYSKQRGRSFYVQLDQNVPVELYYDVVELSGGKLHVYQDVYWRVRDKMSVVRQKLEAEGFKMEFLDLKQVEEQLKSNKNRQDLEFEVVALISNPRERERYLEKITQDKNKLASALLESQAVN